MLYLECYDTILKHIFYLPHQPNTELDNVMKIESDTVLFFYLKVTKKCHNPPEYCSEIIFIFNSSTTITDSNASNTITGINPSNPAGMKESSINKDAKSKNKMYSQASEVSTHTKEITLQNAKRSLFQPSNVITETNSKSQKKTHTSRKTDGQTNVFSLKKKHD